MSDISARSGACRNCSQQLEPGDAYCCQCGQPTGAIVWSFSTREAPGRGSIAIRPGDTFYLVAQNTGTASVRVEVDSRSASGILQQPPTPMRVEPGQSHAFALRHSPEETPGGLLRACSEDGRRRDWWERRSRRELELPVARAVHVYRETWLPGSPTLLFPPGVRRQTLRVWNDAPRERTLFCAPPGGYQVTCGDRRIEEGLSAGPGVGVDLEISLLPTGPGAAPDAEWRLEPAGEPITLLSLPRARQDAGADVVLAIDFGTRNTSIRVRWRRALVATKPAGTVDLIGDRAGAARFPTEMVIDRRERGFLWGSEAAFYIAARRTTAEEVAIENLKTYLREGVEHFTAFRAEWTTAELVGRYFERLFERIDAYFAVADPTTPLNRDSLQIRYVLTRPVLDADGKDSKGQAYEQALRRALTRCGVQEESITFLQEPVAAAIGIARSRAGDLLTLPDGAVVAVVDSGGGTTDVALARVRLREGKVSLDISGSYALRLAPDNPATPALVRFGAEDRLEVGGNTLDVALWNALLSEAAPLLESELQNPLPQTLMLAPPDISSEELAVRKRVFLAHCRHMKERFAVASRQYLNRPGGQPVEPGETLPFPNRPEYAGIYLEHALYDERLLAPILNPVVGALRERLTSDAGPPDGAHIAQVKRLFYVGGTNIDPFVRDRFARAFPAAPPERDPDAQSPARIAERLHAVVEGAVWVDERLYAPSPLELVVAMGDEERLLLREGAPVLPETLARPVFYSRALDPWEELEACLIVSGGGLREPIVAAQTFYRNPADEVSEVTLRVLVSQERGVTGTLLADGRELDQWRFALVERRR